MHPWIRVAAIASVALAAGTALARGVSAHIEDLEVAASAVNDAVAGDPVRSKAAKAILALLAKKSNTRSLANEIRSVRAAAKIAEAKLPLLLDDALGQAADAYAADLASTRAMLELATTSPTAPKGQKRRWQAALARFDRALPAGPPPADVADRLAALAAAATAGRGFTPYDAGATRDWVLSTIALAPATQGVDLDGDGTADNMLGSLRATAGTAGVDLDAMFAQLFAQAGGFTLIEMWSVQRISADPFVLAGILPATDGDADSQNDFSGSGVFAVAAADVDAAGHPNEAAVTGTSRHGAYAIDFTGRPVAFAGFSLPAGAPVVVKGAATAASNSGRIGVAIPMTTLFAAIEAGGTPLNDFTKTVLMGFADLDVDGTPGNDAISATFTFTAVAATKTVAP
jgi:hypothetical protein